jgi:phosphodiesterase/alkaline phosphatase D-like protein
LPLRPLLRENTRELREERVHSFNHLQVVAACRLLTARAPPERDGGTAAQGRAGPRITHGIAAGEVTATSAGIWSRCTRAADLHVVIDGVRASRDAAAIAAKDIRL